MSPLIQADVFNKQATSRSLGRESSVAVKVVEELKVGDAYHYDLPWIEKNMKGETVEKAVAMIVSRIGSHSSKVGKSLGYRIRTKKVINLKTQEKDGLMVLKVALPSENSVDADEDEDE